MSSSSSLVNSSSRPIESYRATFEDQPQDETILKVSQTSETILRKRGREEEAVSQKRRKQNEPAVPSEKESSKKEIAGDLSMDADTEDFLCNLHPVDWFQSEQEAGERRELRSSFIEDEPCFYSETCMNPDHFFTFQELDHNSQSASGKTVDSSKDQYEKDIVDQTPYSTEQLTYANDSINLQLHPKEVIQPGTATVLRSFPASFVKISTKTPWTLIYSSGDKYVGEVVKKIPCGEGTFICSNGIQYKGIFENGLLHGYGEVILLDKTRYLGNFVKGAPSNKGSLHQIDGTIIESNTWDCNLQTKAGKIIYPDKSIYEGPFMNFKPHGRGSFVSSKKELYKGTFENGRLHGYGELVLEDKTRYLGNFVKGVPSGKGSLHQTDGTIIESNRWGCNLQAKTGKIIYPDKTIYKGPLINLQAHGKGTFTYPSKDRYEGEIVNGIPSGKGSFFSSTGKRYKGIFANGLLDGKVEVIFPDKKKYEGFFINGKPSGRGLLFLPDGTLIESEAWNDNIQTESGKIIYPGKKKIYEGSFINLQPHGIGRLTDSSDLDRKKTWRYEGNFIDGEPSGNGSLFLADGTIVESDAWPPKLWPESAKIIYPDMTVYEGPLIKLEPDDVREQFTYLNGRQYISINLQPDGREQSPDLNQRYYTGFFWSRRQHGEGKATFQDGKRYEGNFVYGEPSGKGSLFLPDQIIIESDEWTYNLQASSGKIFYPDTKIYEGSLIDLQPDGIGRLICPGNFVYQGSFEHGKIVSGTLTTPSGKTTPIKSHNS